MTPTPPSTSLNVSATTMTPSPSPIKKRPRAKEPKTDPKILARQRELYHKRKERQKNDPNFGKKDKLVKMVKLDQQGKSQKRNCKILNFSKALMKYWELKYMIQFILYKFRLWMFE